MARERHVFPTHEIPHLWAHQTQEDARNPQGNLYFKGEAIYSYRDSFPIARFVEHEGKRAVMFTTARYSVTTAGHCSAVRQAIPPGVKVLNVPQVYPYQGHTSNVENYRQEITERVEKAARARLESTVTYLLSGASKWRNEALEYCKFWGIENEEFPRVPSISSQAMVELTAKLRKQAGEKAQKAKEKARELIAQWRTGGSGYGLGYALPTMLRLKGDNVETSRGVSFPADHALRGMRFVKLVMAAGEEWVRNGHTFHLGNYSLDRIEPNGTVHAGCHVVEWGEIERLVPELERWEMNRPRGAGERSSPMRYMVERNYVRVVGKIWMPAITAATEYQLSKYDLENIGEFTRENVEQWLGTHAGDFQSIKDFYATAGDIEIPWGTEEGEGVYNDCTFQD